MTLPRQIPAEMPESERAKWIVVRLDTHLPLPGLILTADADTGTAMIRERGPDTIAQDGTRTPTHKDVSYTLGPGSLAIVRQ